MMGWAWVLFDFHNDWWSWWDGELWIRRQGIRRQGVRRQGVRVVGVQLSGFMAIRFKWVIVWFYHAGDIKLVWDKDKWVGWVRYLSKPKYVYLQMMTHYCAFDTFASPVWLPPPRFLPLEASAANKFLQCVSCRHKPPHEPNASEGSVLGGTVNTSQFHSYPISRSSCPQPSSPLKEKCQAECVELEFTVVMSVKRGYIELMKVRLY